MPVREITQGQRFKVVAWGDDRHCEVLEFLEELSGNANSDAARLLYLISRTAQQGPPENESQCRPLGDGIFEFKAPSTARLLWFYDAGRLIICTHGFAGKSGRGKTSKTEIERAKRIRELYLKEKEHGNRN
jgi:phage-related protein